MRKFAGVSCLEVTFGSIKTWYTPLEEFRTAGYNEVTEEQPAIAKPDGSISTFHSLFRSDLHSTSGPFTSLWFAMNPILLSSGPSSVDPSIADHCEPSPSRIANHLYLSQLSLPPFVQYLLPVHEEPDANPTHSALDDGSVTH